MTETQFKTKVVRLLKKELPDAWVYHASDKWRSGIPDIFIVHRGCFVAIELKVGKNIPTKLQYYTLAKIEAAGAATWICNGDNGLDGVRVIIGIIKEKTWMKGKF